MNLDPESCWRALRTHDTRFDGRFFVGVASTRVYCRPVCTARSPRRENCRFFPSAAAAEIAGFRPCLRCRPELAPGFATIDVPARLAQAAVQMIEDGFLETSSVDALAGRVGVTPRHLRRVFGDAFGVSPIAYAQTHRLLLAKRLLTDTSLPITDVAFASGFASVRRFNALFRSRYRMPPGEVRARREAKHPSGQHLAFELAWRPPYAFPLLIDFLGARAIDGVEAVAGGVYRRALAIEGRAGLHRGWIEATRSRARPALSVRLSPSLSKVIPAVLARVRHVFDLSCDPAQVEETLGELAADCRGLRVPGAFDGFEVACRAIAGQQVSVASARTVLSRLAARFGDGLEDMAPAGLSRTFPAAQRIAAVDAATLAEVGLPKARARSMIALAQEIASGQLDLSPRADVEATLAHLESLPGIGPWTAQYIAMRALAWPDAFPHPDLGVMRALGETRPARALALADAWRPWRAYAVVHLWSRSA